MIQVRWMVNKKDFDKRPVVSKILNDDWVVNLNRKKGDMMMESLLKGFRERLKKEIEEGDVSNEMKDLQKIYMDSEKQLRIDEENALDSLHYYMKHYVEKRQEREFVTDKLIDLNRKLEEGEKEEDEDD